MKTLIIAVGIILLLLIFKAKENTHVTLTKNDTILAMGDSLTYGFTAEPNESYPFRLSLLSGLKVINAGVSGETSQEGLRRLPALLNDPSIKLIILCFGGNDILQRRSMDALKQNLKTMIGMARKKKIDVLLISVPHISLLGLSPLDLYDEVAEEENIPLLSGTLADILSKPSLKNDQIHPNAAGYKKMAEKIYETLQKEGWLEG